MVGNGGELCRMVENGGKWCGLMGNGAKLCRMGGIWFGIVQNDTEGGEW